MKKRDKKKKLRKMAAKRTGQAVRAVKDKRVKKKVTAAPRRKKQLIGSKRQAPVMAPERDKSGMSDDDHLRYAKMARRAAPVQPASQPLTVDELADDPFYGDNDESDEGESMDADKG